MDKYEKNTIVTGTVTGIEKYGIFVSFDDNYSGLIHISEINGQFIKNINDYAMVGEKISAKIVDIDDEYHHLKLSIKDMDYRMIKKRNTKIIETRHGFSTLKENLDLWIHRKKAELLKN